MRGNSLASIVAAILAIGKLAVPSTFSSPSGPRHTPKLSGRPERGWRSVQRRARFAKLSRRVRANGRAA